MVSEKYKIDQAISPVAVSANGTTGRYFELANYQTGTFQWVAVVSASLTCTSTGLIYQATDAAATSAAAITATATIIYATSNSTLVLVTPAVTWSAADTITINGLVFTTISSTATTSNREFVYCTAGGTSNVSTGLTNLAAIINDADYGVPGVYASVSTTVLTLRLKNPGVKPSASYNGIVVTASITTNLPITIKEMAGIIEIDATRLTLSSNFTHIALNVINVSAAWTSAVIVRSGARYKEVTQIEPLTEVL